MKIGFAVARLLVCACLAAAGCGRSGLSVEPAAPRCGAGIVSCDGTCTDTRYDPHHCGACGFSCADAELCSDGTCVTVGAPADASGPRSDDMATGLPDLAHLEANPDLADGSSTPDLGPACAPGACGDGGSVWTTLGGDIRHTGYNANERGGLPSAQAWSVTLGSSPLWPAVSDGARIFVTAQSHSYGAPMPLSALDPADGHTVWTYNFGDVFAVGQPTVEGGHVFVGQSNNYNDTFMFSFGATDGTLSWQRAFNSQWEHYWAPLVVNGRVYFDGGTYGGLYALNEADGAQLFFEDRAQWDEWSPLFLGDHLYTFTDGSLDECDPTSGALQATAAVTWHWNGYSMNTAPISDGSLVFVVSPPNVVAFSPSLGAPVWTANDVYSSAPAVANGVVYAVSNTQLRALDAKSGALLWSYTADDVLDHPPVIAGGYVYVASENHVYALDLGTHALSWTGAPGGWLSIAGGQLLVAAPTGVLTAWTLTR